MKYVLNVASRFSGVDFRNVSFLRMQESIIDSRLHGNDNIHTYLTGLKPLATLFGLLFTLSTLSYSQFEKLGVGGRAQGMGYAYTADATDSFSIFFNPANIAFIEDFEASAEYGRYYPGLTDGSNIFNGFAGASYSFQKKDKKLLSLGLAYDSLSLINFYKESQLYLTMAKSFELFSLGVNIKSLELDYTPGNDRYSGNSLGRSGVTEPVPVPDPVYRNGSKKSALGIDLGINIRLSNRLRLGVSAINMNSPDMSLVSFDKLIPVYRAGLSFTGNIAGLNLDVVSKNNDLTVSAGGEYDLFKNLIFGRAGAIYGTRNLKTVTAGLCYRFGDYSFDYSVGYPLSGLIDTFGVHRFSVSFGNGYSKKHYSGYQTVRQTVVPSGPVKDVVKSQELFAAAKTMIDEGSYAAAMQKLDEALNLDMTNIKINIWLEKTKKLMNITPEEKGQDSNSVLFRKAMRYFMDDEVRKAYFLVKYMADTTQVTLYKNVADFLQKEYSYILKEDTPVEGMKIVEYKLNRALNFIYDNKFDLAVLETKDILGVEPGNILAMTRLGSAYYGMDKKDEAKKIWMRIMELDPDNKDVKEFLAGNVDIKKKDKSGVPDVVRDEYERSVKYYFQIQNELDAEGKINFLKRIRSKFEKYELDFTAIDAELKKLK